MSRVVRAEIYPELPRGLQCAEVWSRGNSLLQGLQKHLLEVQHLRQTPEQALHLGEVDETTDGVILRSSCCFRKRLFKIVRKANVMQKKANTK